MHDLDSVTPSGQSYAWSQHTELDGPAISSPTFLCSCLGITNVLGETVSSGICSGGYRSPSPL